MNISTISKLIRLNQDFYERIGPIWNPSADYIWQGWEMINEELIIYNKKLQSPLSPVTAMTSSPEAQTNALNNQVDNQNEFISNPKSPNSTEYKDVLNCTKKLRVLDLGCGNARYASFLAKTYPKTQIEYYGLDNSDFLLSQARQNLELELSLNNNTTLQETTSSGYTCHSSAEGNFSPNLTINLTKSDIILESWDANFTSYKFDLIVLFGLLHHVPSSHQRLALLQKATKLLNPNGVLIFTTWRFTHIPRLQKRIIDIHSNRGQHILNQINLTPTELEDGDCILDWVKTKLAYRYSHDFNDLEINQLLNDSKLDILRRFCADGRTEDQNEYFLCHKLD